MNKLQRLTNDLSRLKRVLIAFSGGVDSTFLLAAARKALGKDNVLAVTAVSETYPAAERDRARRLARAFDVRHRLIHTSEFSDPRFRANPANRCFYCKDELFRALTTIARKERMVLCDANNYSDRSDVRPGKKAAKKWRVASPLERVRMTKKEIRQLSRAMKLPTWDLPAQACLASRIPYGRNIERADLARIEKAEDFLKKIVPGNVRLRHHGEIARIEVDRAQLPALLAGGRSEAIARHLRKLGWRYVCIDIEGYRTGSLNRARRKNA